MTANTMQSAEPIPGYVLQERLGAGGYGEVWKAEAPGGLPKAIKFVYGYHDEDRAARELKALNRIKQVRHPFLLSLERIEIIDGQLLIVTELADASLKDLFTERRGEGLPGIARDELLQHMRDTADALDYMNEQFSLQHLDIKPENLLLVGGRIKVGDFGLVKDIHDNTMSLMGGLTPIYAPPEVFDGRPSRRSDQYSLAIVYQQMLTGDLPFAGRTAAQLASQHLHGKPRLTGLSPEDQAVLERALAKEPSDRFASCREMVDRLCVVRNAEYGMRKADCPTPDSRLPTPSSRRLAQTEIIGGEDAAVGVIPPTSVNERPIPREAAQPTPVAFEGDTFVPTAKGKGPIVALPPIEAVAFQLHLRPTVFVGIGGAAAAALLGLRARMHDRFGGAADAPAFRMLLIDSDPQTLREAEYAENGAPFDASETLGAPLRRPQDYRNKTSSHLGWLSRRWLYNIPRSLKTEGLRPLGRLAMADHAPLILQRLEETIVAAAAPDAIAASAQRLGAEFASDRPRIVVVASISGGTGGGTALDAAYFVRQALANARLESDEVDCVLMHATPRSPQGKELAVANAFAFLREWRHYQRRGYPGDRACGLPPFDATPPFDSAYLVHLGDDLGNDEFQASAERVADYLFLDSFTAAGDVFLRCRTDGRAEEQSKEEDGREPMLRTFGVCPLGAAGREQTGRLVETLCRGVIDRWRGVAEQSRAARLSGASPAPARDDVPEPPLDPAAVERAGGLRIDLEEWRRRIQQIVEALLHSDPEAFFTGLAAEAIPDDQTPADWSALTAEALRGVNEVLGHREAEGDYHEAHEESVVAALEKRIESLAGRQAGAIQRCVWERLDAPKGMVRSAQHALKEYQELVRAMEQQARTDRQAMEPQLAALQQQIRTFRPAEPRRGGRGAAQPSPHEAVRQLLLDYARRRLASVCLQAACKLAQTVLRQLGLMGDELKELARSIDKAAGQFSLYYEEGPGETNAIAAALRDRTPELISLLDEQFRSSFFPAGEGFRAALRKDVQFAERMPEALRDAARRAASEAIRSIDLAGVLFPEEEDTLKTHERLAAIIQAAQPRLSHGGGAARSLLVLPDEAASSRLASLFAARLNQPPTTACDARCDAAFCFEMEQLAVAPLAAMLIDGRRDLAEAASRLHTRSDVNWSPWPRTSE